MKQPKIQKLISLPADWVNRITDRYVDRGDCDNFCDAVRAIIRNAIDPHGKLSNPTPRGRPKKRKEAKK